MFFEREILDGLGVVGFWVVGIAVAAFFCWLTDFMKKDRNR